MGGIAALLEQNEHGGFHSPLRILRIQTSVSFGSKIDCAPQTFSLFVDSDGSYFFRHSKLYEDEKRRVRKYPVEKDAIETLLRQLDRLTIPACPEHELGCDGGDTELEVAGFGGKSLFRWWSVPPAGWEEMNKIVEDMLALIPGLWEEDDEPVIEDQVSI